MMGRILHKCRLQRRTGVKNEDIDDFVRKTTELERAIKGLADGTLKPEDVKIEGIETEEEKEKKKVRVDMCSLSSN